MSPVCFRVEIKYPAGCCLCCRPVSSGFPRLLCIAWKSFNCWKLWPQGPAGGSSVAAGEQFNGNCCKITMMLTLDGTQVSVSKFGGDPSRVTIFGSGSGAVSVHAHILSPQGEGLFQVIRLGPKTRKSQIDPLLGCHFPERQHADPLRDDVQQPGDYSDLKTPLTFWVSKVERSGQRLAERLNCIDPDPLPCLQV